MEAPSSVRPTSLETEVSTVLFSTKPDRAELAHFLSMVEEHDATIDDSTRAEVVRWVHRGSFSQAVEILDRLLERTPSNCSVLELRQLLSSSALRLLRGRLGSRQRRVARSRRADADSLPPSFARFVKLADTRPRLGELLSAFGRDDLRAHEQVVALARAGFLELGSPPPKGRDRDESESDPPDAIPIRRSRAN